VHAIEDLCRRILLLLLVMVLFGFHTFTVAVGLFTRELVLTQQLGLRMRASVERGEHWLRRGPALRLLWVRGYHLRLKLGLSPSSHHSSDI
jgi:hypothetical protein